MEFLNNINSTGSRRLSFIAEWYQEEAGIIRSFLISFYPGDQSLEVFEQRSKKTFLRRTKMPDITVKDLFIGSKISVFGRQFDIVDYGDDVTKNSLAKFRTRTFMLLKHNIVPRLGQILSRLLESDVRISEGIMVRFSPEMARKFLGEENKGDVKMAVLMNELLAGPSIGFILIADNVMEKLKACQDQTKESYGTDVNPSMRQLFEEEDFRNGIYCSQSDNDANREIDFFFSSKSGLSLTTTCHNTTLAVIKPHAIKEGKLGEIISEITNRGFKINALKMQLLERVNCEEFYEVYRGILPEYIVSTFLTTLYKFTSVSSIKQMVAQLASGVCMALEIANKDDSIDSYKDFREFCGPMDPEVAKLLRPTSLRAKFGTNKVMNAIHCTDLQEDTTLEVQYFFKIIVDT